MKKLINLSNWGYNLIREITYQIIYFNQIKHNSLNFKKVWKEQIIKGIEWRGGENKFDEQFNSILLQSIFDDYLLNKNDTSILELGSHNGNSIKFFNKFDKIYLSDIFDESFEYIKSNHFLFCKERFNFIKLNGIDLDNVNLKFNFIFSIDSLSRVSSSVIIQYFNIPDLFSSKSLRKHFTFFPSYILYFYLRDFEEIKFIRNLNYFGGVFLYAKKRK